MRHLIFFFAATALAAYADISIKPGRFTVGPQITSADSVFELTVSCQGGFIMRHPSKRDGVFKIHLPSVPDTAEFRSPSISGNGGVMSLYYEAYQKKQSLNCGNIYQMSDERSKEDINDLPGVLGLLTESIDPVGPMKSRSSGDAMSSTMKQTSLYASIAPSSVVEADGDTAINYSEIIPALIKSVQELNELADRQDAVIEKLKNEITLKKQAVQSSVRIRSCSPNPAQDNISVAIEIGETIAGLRLSMADVGGNRCLSQDLGDNNNVTLSVGHLPRGIYHLILSTDTEVYDTYRIILN